MAQEKLEHDFVAMASRVTAIEEKLDIFEQELMSFRQAIVEKLDELLEKYNEDTRNPDKGLYARLQALSHDIETKRQFEAAQHVMMGENIRRVENEVVKLTEHNKHLATSHKKLVKVFWLAAGAFIGITQFHHLADVLKLLSTVN